MSAPGIRTQANNRKSKTPKSVVGVTADPAAPMAEQNEVSNVPEPKTEEVARIAYSYWESRAGEGGSAEEDWLRAEQELRARK